MERLLGILGDVGDARAGSGDSFCDRLNCRYTTFILVIFAILVTTKHYVGEPIACWCPAHFTDSHVDYTNKVCWVTNNYYLPFNMEIPKEDEAHNMIGYYQWVGLILCLQACLFYVPRCIWRLLNKKSGIAVTTITDAAIECQRKTDQEGKSKTLKYMTSHMGRFLRDLNRKHTVATNCKSLWWAFYGNYLVVLYLLIKALYIANVIGQLFLLNAFLGTNYSAYGIEVLKLMLQGKSWTTSDRFPRVTFCDFKIRLIGNIQRYTVQCTLPANLFNEKIFLFLWFWLIFVATATVGSFLLWLATSLYFPQQLRYIETRIIAMEKLKKCPPRMVRDFVSNFLRRDGVFLIRLVSKNASDVIAAELVCGLWDIYKSVHRSIERRASNASTIGSDAGKV